MYNQGGSLNKKPLMSITDRKPHRNEPGICLIWLLGSGRSITGNWLYHLQEGKFKLYI